MAVAVQKEEVVQGRSALDDVSATGAQIEHTDVPVGERRGWACRQSTTVVLLALVGALAAVVAAELVPVQTLETRLVQLAAICAGALVAMPRRVARRPVRIALIGSQSTAVALEQEFVINGIESYVTVGWIASGSQSAQTFPRPRPLGSMGDVATVVEQYDVDLLLIGSDVPRLAVFDELVELTDLSEIRVCELTAFYEELFGHIPVAEINSAWFQYIMHPKFRPSSNRTKRVFDLALATVLGLAFLPALLVAALLIKLDGGSILYVQRRIGEKGRPFDMYKLRTMRAPRPEDADARWCSVDDPRITRVGSVLRRLHIDELPQLLNVLRGEMSIVGPRPEQPEIVGRLESALAYYSRRHLIKPGIAGWAQVRCGYARSERGSAWKLCHDLYYIKHQSLLLDVRILAQTLLTLASQAAWGEDRDAPFVIKRDSSLPEPAMAAERAA